MFKQLKLGIVRHLLFPMQEKLKGHSTFKVLKGLEKSQWLNEQQLADLQAQKLKNFFSDTVAKSEYFKTVFAQRELCVADIKSVSDLQKLPFMDKQTIRDNTPQIATADLDSLSINRTGGSSGEPLVFYTSSQRTSHDIAARMRANRWFGVDIGNKELVVWGAPHELNSQDKVKLLRDRLFRSKLISAFNMSDAQMPEMIQSMREYKPEMIFAYPSAVYNIASYCIKHNINLSLNNLKAIFVTSEMLFDDQRKVIEQAFKAPVVNEYGGRDGGFIARECEHGNFHINAEDILVEIVDSQGNVVANGESGEVVVTHLQSFGFPFVRYKMGDIAAISKQACKCGRVLPVLKSLEGRVNDFLVGVDDRKVHPNVANYIIRLNADVLQYKVKQAADKSLSIDLVSNVELSSEAKNIIAGDFVKRLGDVPVLVSQVEVIVAEKSGKRRYVISEVK